MPRLPRSKCSTRRCRNSGPYSRDLGLCHSCGIKRMRKGALAGAVKDNGQAGQRSGLQSKCSTPRCRNSGPYSRHRGKRCFRRARFGEPLWRALSFFSWYLLFVTHEGSIGGMSSARPTSRGERPDTQGATPERSPGI